MRRVWSQVKLEGRKSAEKISTYPEDTLALPFLQEGLCVAITGGHLGSFQFPFVYLHDLDHRLQEAGERHSLPLSFLQTCLPQSFPAFLALGVECPHCEAPVYKGRARKLTYFEHPSYGGCLLYTTLLLSRIALRLGFIQIQVRLWS